MYLLERMSTLPKMQRTISAVIVSSMLGQTLVPGMAFAFDSVSNASAQTYLVENKNFSDEPSEKFLFSAGDYIDLSSFEHYGSIEKLFNKIKLSGLSSTSGLSLGKLVGDSYVQSRLIRYQIFNSLNRVMSSFTYRDEDHQISTLYENSFEFAKKYGYRFGRVMTNSLAAGFNKDFVWPEERLINGVKVLVPVVYLTSATISRMKIRGHQVEFSGEEALFSNILVNAGVIYTRRNTFLSSLNNFYVNNSASLVAEGDLNLFAGGTMLNMSGHFSAKDNVNILAGQYGQKTVLHRYSTKYGQSTRYGEIASINASNGKVALRSYGDIRLVGGTVKGNNVEFSADGNISISSQSSTQISNEIIDGYSVNQSITEHLKSKISAENKIALMAKGAIEITASEIISDNGMVEILANQGIYISDAQGKFQRSRTGKKGDVSLQENEFQTIAIRSALDAGRGVIISTDLGDITLKASKIKSAEGATVSAKDGRVNLLLSKEQDHYFSQTVKSGFWKIKTETKEDKEENAVYNSVLGGIEIQAQKGVSLELGIKEGETLSDVMDSFRQAPDLAWMVKLYDDDRYRENIDLVYSKLVELHKHEKKSQLGPGPMAFIAIAMSCILGPGGLAGLNATLTNALTSFGLGQTATVAAIQAATVSLATQVTVSTLNGDSLDETLKTVSSSESLKNLAATMVTAGVMSLPALKKLNFFEQVKGDNLTTAQQVQNLGYQINNVLIQTSVRTVVPALIKGEKIRDFDGTLKRSLMTYAVSNIGASLANEIGDLAGKNEFHEAIRYVAHAGLGCGMGAATGAIDGRDGDSSASCASGALGAVVGELSQALYVDGMSPDDEELSTEELIALRDRLKRNGVNIARLSGAMSGLIAGLDVDIASQTAQNSAQNNFWAHAARAALWLANLYALEQSAEEFIELLDEYNNTPEDQKADFLQKLARRVASDRALEYFAEKALKTKVVSDAAAGLYAIAKASPLAPFIAKRLDNWLDKDVLKDMPVEQKAIFKAKAETDAEAMKAFSDLVAEADFEAYKKLKPGTRITIGKVKKEYRNGKVLTKNGRFKLTSKKVNIPDSDEYRRVKLGGDTRDLSSDLKGIRVKSPDLPGGEGSVEELLDKRQALLDRARELTAARARGAQLTHAQKSEIVSSNYRAGLLSETLGLASAEVFISKKYEILEKLPTGYLDKSKQRQFDMLMKVKDRSTGEIRVLEIEAKGAGGTFGHAQVGADTAGKVLSAQQCSAKYRAKIWEDMEAKLEEYKRLPSYINGTMSTEELKVITSLQTSLDWQERLPVTAVSVQQPVDFNTGQLKSAVFSIYQ